MGQIIFVSLDSKVFNWTTLVSKSYNLNGRIWFAIRTGYKHEVGYCSAINQYKYLNPIEGQQ